MAANNPFSDLMKLQAQSAAMQQAGSFNTGSGFLDKVRPIIDFLAGAQQSYAAGNDSGNIIAGLGGMTQGMSKRNYLNQLQQQQLAAFEYQKKLDALAQQQKYNTVQGINNYAQGNAFQFDPNSDVSTVSDLAKLHLPQASAATNFANAGAGYDAIQGGQQSSTFGGVLNPRAVQALTGQEVPVQGEQLPPMDYAGTEYEQPATQQFTAGAAYQAPPPSIDTMGNPFFMPSDVPNNIAAQQRAGLGDIKDKATLDETIRNNSNDYALGQGQLSIEKGKLGIAQKELQAKIAGNYFKNYPPAGPAARAPNEIDLVRQFMAQGYTPEQATRMAGMQGSGGDNTKNIIEQNKTMVGLAKLNADNAAAQYGENSQQHKMAIGQLTQASAVAMQNIAKANQGSQAIIPQAQRGAAAAGSNASARLEQARRELGLKK